MTPPLFDFDQLHVREVSRHFGRRRVLTKVSFTVGAGEVVGLLGPNGAGKSTLLAILATSLAPSGGEIWFGEVRSTDAQAEARRRLGLLAHDLCLYPELTARENLEFFGRLYGLAHWRARAIEALARAGLEDRGDDLVSSFSRGMRQRLALERALLHEPRLVLLDEPFTGLDDQAAALLSARLRRLAEDRRLIVVATHDLELAEGVIDRAILLRDGRAVPIEQGRALREAYRRALA